MALGNEWELTMSALSLSPCQEVGTLVQSFSQIDKPNLSSPVGALIGGMKAQESDIPTDK